MDERVQVYAVLRHDEFLSDACLEDRIAVQRVVRTLEEAEGEVARLNALNGSKGAHYWWRATRLRAPLREDTRRDAAATSSIVVTQGTEDPYLEFRDVRRLSDGSGFASTIHVRCHGFAGSQPFYFSRRAFASALGSLRQMNKHLRGEARLDWDEDHERLQYVQFIMQPRGHVQVSGELTLFAPHENRLEFCFEADQTCLAALVRSLDALES